MLDSKADSENFSKKESTSSNSTPAVKKTESKKEEEISIEDIPF